MSFPNIKKVKIFFADKPEILYMLGVIGGLVLLAIVSDFWIPYFQHALLYVAPNYNYKNPPIYFSIGEALSALGLILAIYQLRRGTWLIALSVRKETMYVLSILLTCGLFCVFAASIVPQTISENPNAVFQMALFWEIFGALLFLATPLGSVKDEGGDGEGVGLF